MSEQLIVGVSYYLFPGEYKALDAHAAALVKLWDVNGGERPKSVLDELSSPETPGAFSRTLGALWEQGKNALLVYYYDDTALLVGLRLRTPETPEWWKEWFKSGSVEPRPYQCSFIDVIETDEEPAAEAASRWPTVRVIAPPMPAGLEVDAVWSDFYWRVSGSNEYRIISRSQNRWLHYWCFGEAHLIRLLLFHGKADRYQRELEQAAELAVRADGLSPADTQSCERKRENIHKALTNFDAEWDRASLDGQPNSSLGKVFLGAHKTWRDQSQRHLQVIDPSRKEIVPQGGAATSPVPAVEWTGPRKGILTKALVHAFNTDHDLASFALFGFGLDLDAISGPGFGREKKAFDLIQRADAQGILTDLFLKAVEVRPNNEELQKAKTAILGKGSR